MSPEKIATYLSVILGPHVWFPLLFLIATFSVGLTQSQLYILFPSLLTLLVVVPITYILFAPKLGWVEKWDMENKEERKPFLILLFISALISVVLIYIFGNKMLFDLALILIALLLALFTITRCWKISLHTPLITAAVIIINFLFAWKLPLLYILIIIVFWARLKLEKHSKNQLIAGVVLTTSIVLGGLAIFGYLQI